MKLKHGTLSKGAGQTASQNEGALRIIRLSEGEPAQTGTELKLFKKQSFLSIHGGYKIEFA